MKKFYCQICEQPFESDEPDALYCETCCGHLATYLTTGRCEIDGDEPELSEREERDNEIRETREFNSK
jgi:Zn finger protein HypA/HybF involved in hydrogenase expression